MTRFNGTSCFHIPCSYLGSSYHTKGLVGPLQELSDPDLEAVLFIGMSSKHSTGPDIQQIFNMFVEWRNNLCCESHPFNGLFQWYMLVKVWGLVWFWSPLQFTPFPGHFAEVFCLWCLWCVVAPNKCFWKKEWMNESMRISKSLPGYRTDKTAICLSMMMRSFLPFKREHEYLQNTLPIKTDSYLGLS